MNFVPQINFGSDRYQMLPAKVKLLMVLMATLFGYWCFLDQYPAVVHPCNCADAYAYTYIGKHYQESGIGDHPWGKLRSYAYPLLLSGVFDVAGFFGFDSAHGVFAVQMALYFICVVILSRSLRQYFSNALGDLVFVALMLNLYIYPVLAISLTDGVSVCVLILIVTLIVKFEFQGFSATRLAALGFLCGLSIMMRPSTIYLLTLLLTTFLYFSFFSSYGLMTKLRWMALSLACFALVVAPQIYINVKYYGEWTFLPAFDLGDFQINHGIEMIKYATNLTEGKPNVPYFNPLATPNSDGVWWYLLNPVNGFITVFLHLFAALDFDYLTVYIFNKDPWYRPVLFVYSQTINFWGFAGLLFGIKQSWHSNIGTMENLRKSYLTSMILLFVLGWASLTSISAVENRFALPMVSLLLPFALWGISSGKLQARLFDVPLKVWFLVYLCLAQAVSWYIGNLKVFGHL